MSSDEYVVTWLIWEACCKYFQLLTLNIVNVYMYLVIRMYIFNFVSKVYTKMEVKKDEMKDKNDIYFLKEELYRHLIHTY